MACRCQSPGRTQPALAVTSRAKTAGGAVDEQSRHLSIDVHTVEARVTPAMAKEAEALLLAVLCASSAHPASSKGLLMLAFHIFVPFFQGLPSSSSFYLPVNIIIRSTVVSR